MEALHLPGREEIHRACVEGEEAVVALMAGLAAKYSQCCRSSSRQFKRRRCESRCWRISCPKTAAIVASHHRVMGTRSRRRAICARRMGRKVAGSPGSQTIPRHRDDADPDDHSPPSADRRHTVSSRILHRRAPDRSYADREFLPDGGVDLRESNHLLFVFRMAEAGDDVVVDLRFACETFLR